MTDLNQIAREAIFNLTIEKTALTVRLAEANTEIEQLRAEVQRLCNTEAPAKTLKPVPASRD